MIQGVGNGITGTVGNTSFSLHHARNVLVYDCAFEQCLKLGHVMGLQGCDGVTVRDCTVLGKAPSTTDSLYKEAIQVDVSTLAGASYADNLGSYDGLPTINVTVDGCRFLPLTVGGTTYPAPNPVGSHASIEGRYYRNITVSNCLIQDAVSDTTSSYFGILHFVAADGVSVVNNRFISTTAQPATGIMFYRTHLGRPWPTWRTRHRTSPTRCLWCPGTSGLPATTSRDLLPPRRRRT
ncbi:hypothetical protein E2F48_10130 [Arthrobacter crusticola]|uniref:Right handed beta helix domain-containing protein n=1 Tax=Arthrobacter crusticola TaxID=2547960 RepID=A0A4R5TWQ9_9MICC|nr:hypothetical protein [Arthrobacter crusticola]TDK25595.1 hypothetical protein E2F48_10130 [Arthrobacter crusticola]